jgi:hypothetical protein
MSLKNNNQLLDGMTRQKPGRNFIKIMEGKGHKFFVSARDKEVTHSLLNSSPLKSI